jgi:hypothetical protein
VAIDIPTMLVHLWASVASTKPAASPEHVAKAALAKTMACRRGGPAPCASPGSDVRSRGSVH